MADKQRIDNNPIDLDDHVDEIMGDILGSARDTTSDDVVDHPEPHHETVVETTEPEVAPAVVVDRIDVMDEPAPAVPETDHFLLDEEFEDSDWYVEGHTHGENDAPGPAATVVRVEAPAAPATTVDDLDVIPRREYESNYSTGGYRAQFDFGDGPIGEFTRKAPASITIVPYVIHLILGLALAGGMLYIWRFDDTPHNPADSEYFMYAVFGLGAIIVLGVIFAFAFGMAARAKSTDPKGHLPAAFGKAGITILLSVAAWYAAFRISEAAALGTPII